MKLTLPKVYYFRLPNEINEQFLNAVKENAIILTGKKQESEGFRADAHLINYEPSTGIKKIRQATLWLRSRRWDDMIKGRNNNTGQITVAGENDPVLGHNGLADDLSKFVSAVDFPHKHVILYFSKDVQAVTVKSKSDLYSDSDSEHVDNTSVQKEMHPILERNSQKNGVPRYNILTLLYMIKADPTVYQSVTLYQEGGVNVGYGITKGAAHRVTVNEMIQLFHKNKKVTFMPAETFFNEADKILQNFKSSKFTSEKKAVFDNFKQFYNANSNNPDMMPRSVLIEKWANKYLIDNAKNPFITLSAQRRELGALRFLSPLLNPSQTNSIKLFHQFIAGEEKSASLHRLMDNKDTPLTQVLNQLGKKKNRSMGLG